MSARSDQWCSASDPGTSPQAQAFRDARARGVDMDSLCQMGWRPIMITGLIRDILARHFQEGQVEDPQLQHLVWNEGERTGILIESITRWRGELVGKRPAVIVKRNAQESIRFVIADRAGLNEQGFFEYSTIWVGSHTLFCIHGSGASAEILATEVQRHVHQFAPAVIDYLGLMRWAVTQMGETAEVEEAKESFVVPVTVAWAYQEMWQVSLESLKLRRVPLRTLLDGAVLSAIS